MNPFENKLKPAALIAVLVNIALVYSDDPSGKGVKAKGDFAEENYGVKYADKCEVCKIVTREVEHQLNSKFKSQEVIHTGYNYLQKDKKKTYYAKSMIRLQEAVEATCGAMLEYNIHKERNDWTRFARGQSQTFSTLHGLKNKGVKVDLGIPHEMWDKPSAEVTQLKSQCESFLEKNEEDIEEWYQAEEKIPLDQYICKKTLKKKEQQCLSVEPPPPVAPSTDKKSKGEKSPKKKSKKGEPKKDPEIAKSSKDESQPVTADQTSRVPSKEETIPGETTHAKSTTTQFPAKESTSKEVSSGDGYPSAENINGQESVIPETPKDTKIAEEPSEEAKSSTAIPDSSKSPEQNPEQSRKEEHSSKDNTKTEL